MLHAELDGAVAAGRVPDHAQAARPVQHPVGGPQVGGHVGGEVGLRPRPVRDVLALAVPGHGGRGPHQHQDGRLHRPRAQQVEFVRRVAQLGDQVGGVPGEAGHHQDGREVHALAAGSEVLRREVDVPVGAQPGRAAGQPHPVQPSGPGRVVAGRAGAGDLRRTEHLHPGGPSAVSYPLRALDHGRPVLVPEQVGPAAVEDEVVVDGEPERRQQGQLRDHDGAQPQEHRGPAADSQPGPHPEGAEHREHREQRRQRQELVTGESHRSRPPLPLWTTGTTVDHLALPNFDKTVEVDMLRLC